MKFSLTLDLNVNYRAGIEITADNLEKNIVNATLLVTGRSLYGTSKNRFSYYRKAPSIATKKWDLKIKEPKESGTTSDDVIEFVLQEMYKDVFNM